MPGIPGNNLNNGHTGGGVGNSTPVTGSTPVNGGQPASNSQVSSTINDANRNRTNESYARANAGRNNLGSRNNGSSIESGSSNKKNKDGLGPIAGMKKKAYEKAMQAGLSTAIGPDAANRLVKSKPIQRRLNDKAKNESLFKTLGGLGKPPKPTDMIKDLANTKEDLSDLRSKKDKQAEMEEKSRDASGDFTAQMSRKTLKAVLLLAPFASLLMIFL